MNDSQGGHTALRAAWLSSPSSPCSPQRPWRLPGTSGTPAAMASRTDQVLVRYEPGTTSAASAPASAASWTPQSSAGCCSRGPSCWSWTPADGVGAAVAALNRQPEVAFAEPDFVYHLAATSQRPVLHDSGRCATTGQSRGAGGRRHRCLPTPGTTRPGARAGLGGRRGQRHRPHHADLDDNIWVNPEESGGTPGVDDDVPANGLNDDVTATTSSHRATTTQATARATGPTWRGSWAPRATTPSASPASTGTSR